MATFQTDNDIEDVLDLNMRVLVVDDSSTMRRILVSALRDIGFTKVATAEDGDDAWDILKLGMTKLVLSDHKMPNMSGEELLRLVRNNEKTKDTPFIMVTSEAFQENVVNAIKLGVSNYIVKPFNTNQLLEKIIKVVGKRDA